jgi:hypothetical protein
MPSLTAGMPDRSIRPWQPVDPVVKLMLGKTGRKLKETGTHQQLTLDQQLRRWVFRIGDPLRLERSAGRLAGTLAESQRFAIPFQVMRICRGSGVVANSLSNALLLKDNSSTSGSVAGSTPVSSQAFPGWILSTKGSNSACR